MPGKQQNISYYAVFNMIRTEIGQDGVAKSRKLEKVELKFNNTFLDLKFNHSCKTENLIPSSLKFSPPVRSSRGFKLPKKFSLQFLKLRITKLHQKICDLRLEKKKLKTELQADLDLDLYQLLSHYIQISKTYQTKQVIITHQKKLNALRKKDRSSNSRTTRIPKQKWVINMSSKKLINPQNAVLVKGFNFAITPKFVPKLGIIDGVEAGLRKVRDEAAVQIARSKVSEICQATTKKYHT